MIFQGKPIIVRDYCSLVTIVNCKLLIPVNRGLLLDMSLMLCRRYPRNTAEVQSSFGMSSFYVLLSGSLEPKQALKVWPVWLEIRVWSTAIYMGYVVYAVVVIPFAPPTPGRFNLPGAGVILKLSGLHITLSWINELYIFFAACYSPF